MKSPGRFPTTLCGGANAISGIWHHSAFGFHSVAARTRYISIHSYCEGWWPTLVGEMQLFGAAAVNGPSAGKPQPSAESCNPHRFQLLDHLLPFHLMPDIFLQCETSVVGTALTRKKAKFLFLKAKIYMYIPSLHTRPGIRLRSNLLQGRQIFRVEAGTETSVRLDGWR